MKKTKFKQTEIGTIPEAWGVDKLKDHLIIKGRIGWKGLKKSEYLEEGYAIINGEQIKNSKLDWGGCGRISEERYDESPEIQLQEEDIVMTKDGTIGKTAYVDVLPEPTSVASGIFVIRSKSKKLYQRFLYCYFKSDYFKWLIESRIEGSVIPHLYQRDIVELEIPLPQLQEQKFIAKILSDLDRKIEVNRRMNEILEELGQTLFKRWFVDFEFPNEKGKPYKSSGGQMVETDFGEIPISWKYTFMSEVIYELESGNRPKGGITKLDEGIPSIGAENIIGLGKFNYDNNKLIPEEFFNKMNRGIVKDKDVLLYKDGAQLGRKTMFGSGFPFTKCCINEHVFIIRSNEKISQEYLFFWLDQNYMTSEIINLNANSAQPGINKESVGRLPILIPNKNISMKFQNLTSKLIEKILKNALLIRELSKTRDLLLPKLMSGKIRVISK